MRPDYSRLVNSISFHLPILKTMIGEGATNQFNPSHAFSMLRDAKPALDNLGEMLDKKVTWQADYSGARGTKGTLSISEGVREAKIQDGTQALSSMLKYPTSNVLSAYSNVQRDLPAFTGMFKDPLKEGDEGYGNQRQAKEVKYYDGSSSSSETLASPNVLSGHIGNLIRVADSYKSTSIVNLPRLVGNALAESRDVVHGLREYIDSSSISSALGEAHATPEMETNASGKRLASSLRILHEGAEKAIPAMRGMIENKGFFSKAGSFTMTSAFAIGHGKELWDSFNEAKKAFEEVTGKNKPQMKEGESYDDGPIPLVPSSSNDSMLMPSVLSRKISTKLESDEKVRTSGSVVSINLLVNNEISKNANLASKEIEMEEFNDESGFANERETENVSVSPAPISKEATKKPLVMPYDLPNRKGEKKNYWPGEKPNVNNNAAETVASVNNSSSASATLFESIDNNTPQAKTAQENLFASAKAKLDGLGLNKQTGALGISMLNNSEAVEPSISRWDKFKDMAGKAYDFATGADSTKIMQVLMKWGATELKGEEADNYHKKQLIYNIYGGGMGNMTGRPI